MEIFDDFDDFMHSNPKDKCFEIMENANSDIVRNELEKIFEKFVAMEKMLDKIHGENAENKIQEEIMTSETHFTDLQGFYINLMGDILSESE